MKRAIVVLALAAAPLPADEVHLRGGGRLSGEIVEETAENITVDIGAGKMTVRKSTVVNIERTASPLQEYRAHASALAPGDVEGWRKLARWAAEQGLSTQAREAWTAVLAHAPDDAEANGGLGRILYNGQWMSEEDSYRAQGFVKFEGDWMMPAEKQAILEERRADEAAQRAEVAAQIQADQAAARDEEAQRQAEDDEFWEDSLPELGDPVYWGGYGYTPTLWPVQPVQPRRPAQLPAGGRR